MSELDLDALERIAKDARGGPLQTNGLVDLIEILIQRLREAEAKRDDFASDSAFFGQQYANAEAQTYELKARIAQLERVREAAAELIKEPNRILADNEMQDDQYVISGFDFNHLRAALAAVEEPAKL